MGPKKRTFSGRDELPRKKNAKNELIEDGDGEKQWEVNCIRGEQMTKNGRYYLVHWEGWSTDDDSWEHANNVNCSELVDEYHDKLRKDKRMRKQKMKELAASRSAHSSRKKQKIVPLKKHRLLLPHDLDDDPTPPSENPQCQKKVEEKREELEKEKEKRKKESETAVKEEATKHEEKEKREYAARKEVKKEDVKKVETEDGEDTKKSEERKEGKKAEKNALWMERERGRDTGNTSTSRKSQPVVVALNAAIVKKRGVPPLGYDLGYTGMIKGCMKHPRTGEPSFLVRFPEMQITQMISNAVVREKGLLGYLRWAEKQVDINSL